MVLTSIVLAVLGLIAGSFINALVWRVSQQEAAKGQGSSPSLSVLSGRSMCPNCRHQLSALDLIPVLSWVFLAGRCRYCGGKISKQYPLVELLTAIVFAVSFLLWPADLSAAGQKLLLATWLVSAVGLIALAVHDFKQMLLPNRIIYPTLAVAAGGRLAYIIWFSSDKGHSLIEWLLSVLVASGIFWLIFIISSGEWIGFGDVRLGLITGTLLGSPSRGLLMIITGALAGTLIMLPIMAVRKIWRSKIPFGPFLILATAIVMLFGTDILNWYARLASISINY